MQKLKEKKQNHLLDYKPFLKNKNLKNNTFPSKNSIFKNTILFKNEDFIWMETNKYQNILLSHIAPLPNYIKKKNKLFYTIQTQYEKNFLFNFQLNYNSLKKLVRLLFQKTLNLKLSKIKGRILNGTRYKNYIIILSCGNIIKMKSKQLNKNRRLYYGNKLKNMKKTIRRIKLRSIYFKIEENLSLSRKAYICEIIDQQNKIREIERRRKIREIERRRKIRDKKKIKIKNKK